MNINIALFSYRCISRRAVELPIRSTIIHHFDNPTGQRHPQSDRNILRQLFGNEAPSFSSRTLSTIELCVKHVLASVIYRLLYWNLNILRKIINTTLEGTDMVLTMQNIQVLTFHEEGFIQPVSSRCWEITEYANMMIDFLRIHFPREGLTASLEII